MYLLNAVSFSAEWVESFMVTQVEERDFTKEDGTIQRVEMMCTEEDYYLRDSCAGGFLKYYKGGRICHFAGPLLPKRGIMDGAVCSFFDGRTSIFYFNKSYC